MVIRVRVAWRFAACVVSAAIATSCTSAPPASPKLMARCTELYQLWWTYDEDPVFFHTGERAIAELAVDRCKNGRYDEGIGELTKLLKNGRIPIPGV